MTSGEKRFAEALEHHLEDDYLLWYDVPIGPKQLHPDFIILHPSRGLFILEVKDWKLDHIQKVTRTSVTLLTPNGAKEVKNPLQQARDYALAVCKLLEQDASLVSPIGSPYAGKLSFPYGYGVVFSNITRKAFEQSEMGEVLEPHLVICKDERTEGVDSGEFQQQLWNLSHYQFGKTLTRSQIDRVRARLFPELVFGSKQLSFFSPDSPQIVPDLIQIMDLQQEQLARSLGEGHRVVHGVAGSGKTLILAYRCQHLASEQSKPILVLCFNVALASRLRQILKDKELKANVTVCHFHRWCSDRLRSHNISMPDWNQYKGDNYGQALVERVIQAVEAGKIPRGQYGAVMIDEGHDFQPEWLKLVAQMVDPETNSLLVLYDDAQNLYSETGKKKFSFKSVGIKAQGRTTILKVNYRNTAEVLSLAYEFAKEVMTPTDTQEEDMPVLIQPLPAGRRGPLPELVHLPSFKRENQYLAERVIELHDRGTPWNEMAIAYRFRFMGEEIYKALQQAQIPVEWVNQSSASRSYQPDDNSIKLMTMHSSKGLEFPTVFIPGLGYLPNRHSTPVEEARLLYVAMTRAVNQLILTYHQDSEFVLKIQTALESVALRAS